jgi:hypothetical protein
LGDSLIAAFGLEIHQSEGEVEATCMAVLCSRFIQLTGANTLTKKAKSLLTERFTTFEVALIDTTCRNTVLIKEKFFQSWVLHRQNGQKPTYKIISTTLNLTS